MDYVSYRKEFDCEEQSLNNYIQRYARQASDDDIAQTHVLFDTENKKIISYYSTCNYAVQKDSLASWFKVSVKEIPATLIARLAVDKNYKGRGYGGLTLVEALKQIKKMSKLTGIKVIIVDALNEKAVSFYKNFGFIQFDESSTRLFLSISEIEKI